MLKEDRVRVIALYRCGHSPTRIFKLLLNFNIMLRFVYHTINKYGKELSVDGKKRTSRIRSVRTPTVIKAPVATNPVRK